MHKLQQIWIGKKASPFVPFVNIAPSFVANVFSLMFTALIISGISAVWFASDEMKNYIINMEGDLTALGWI